MSDIVLDYDFEQVILSILDLYVLVQQFNQSLHLIITKTTDKSQTSTDESQTSTDESQTSTDESQTSTDESQTAPDESQTGHR